MNAVVAVVFLIFAAYAAVFLVWAERFELSIAGALGRAPERFDVAFSTGGGDVPHPPLTPEQRAVLQRLASVKVQTALQRWLRSLGVARQDRGEVAQDCMVQATRSIAKYDSAKATPERWLNAIAVHVASHHHRRARHRREELRDDLDCDAFDSAPSAHDLIEAAEERAELAQLLAEVPTRDSAILIGHDIDGRPLAELAEERGIPVSTAYHRRARAFEALIAIARRVRT